jgi:transcription-repair coupling factor (superfamily II helicase)
VNEIAQKRMKAIEQYSMLGAGFKIAMRDLEIRGAGNILGSEQSGHIAAVGYEMYCQLLETAVHNLKNDKVSEPPSATSIEIGLSGVVPRAYIPSEQRRLEAYRRIATAATLDELAKVRADLTQAYGDPPRATHRLLELAELKVAASKLDIRTITIREKDVIFRTSNPNGVAEELTRNAAATPGANLASVRPIAPKNPGELAEVYFRPPEKYLEAGTLLAVLRRRLGILPIPTATPSPERPIHSGRVIAKRR